MQHKIEFFFKEFIRNESHTSEQLIDMVRGKIDFVLPDDYIEVIKNYNGGEGEIGANGWLCLFPIEELIEINTSYKFLMSEIADYFMFGKDAADTGYAFHKKNQTIHSFGLMSDFETDPIEFCGNNFLEFLEYLYNQ